MKPEHAGMMEKAKDQIIAANSDSADIASVTVKTVTEILDTTLKDTGKGVVSVAAAIDDVASGAIHGAIHTATDLEQTAKGIMIGVLRGTRVASAEPISTILHTVEVTMRDIAAAGGNLVTAATGLIDGAIAGAAEIGVSAEDAAMAAADGALKAASQAGADTADLVHQAVTKAAQHVQQVLHNQKMAA